MTHDEAVALIRPAVAPGEAWAELGAGEGTFTRALGELVGPDGSVWASDRDPAAVRTLRGLAGAVGLTPPEEVGRRSSRYQGEMYAAVARH